MLSLSANSDFKRNGELTVTNEYYDWDAYSSSSELWGKEALDQMIENVLLTEPHERLFNLGFGSPLYRMLFENFNQIDTIMPQVFNIIEYWVPITIDRASANIEQDEDNHAVAFQLNYTSKNGLYSGTFARRFM